MGARLRASTELLRALEEQKCKADVRLRFREASRKTQVSVDLDKPMVAKNSATRKIYCGVSDSSIATFSPCSTLITRCRVR